MENNKTSQNSEGGFEKKEQTFFRKRHRKSVFFLFVLAFLSGGLYFLWSFMQNPSLGVIRVGTLPAQEESFDQGKELKRFAGASVSFPYPGTFVEKMHETPSDDPVIREKVFLSNSDTEGKKIAVIVEKRAEEGLEASPSYQIRMNDPQTYKRTVIRLGGISGFLFTKDSQVFEQTAFFRRGKEILTISVSSPLRLDTLKEDLENILKNFEWKK